MTTSQFALRIAVALALGTLVGLERQWRQRMAGLRTNALVATGAALFVSISDVVPSNGNPTQIAAYIVSGVGFLAGAVIFKENLSVRGLNTAATLWGTAAVGTLAGIGAFPQAAIGAAAVLAANVLLRPIVQRINRRSFEGTEVARSYEIRVVCRAADENTVRAAMSQALRGDTLRLSSISSQDLEGSERMEVEAVVSAGGTAEPQLERVIAKLSRNSSVSAASWKVIRADEESPVLGDVEA
jgi:putative Mg2+ transporter-C (MgtC) family protein